MKNLRNSLKKKKGEEMMLLGVSLKMLLALAGLVVLAILAVKLYSLLSSSTPKAQAESTLKQIDERIRSVEEGKIKSYLMVAPKDWSLIYIKSKVEFDKNTPYSSRTVILNKECDEKCLCVCKYGKRKVAQTDVYAGFTLEEFDCEDGFCSKLDDIIINPNSNVNNGIKIDITNIYILKNEGVVSIQQKEENV